MSDADLEKILWDDVGDDLPCLGEISAICRHEAGHAVAAWFFSERNVDDPPFHELTAGGAGGARNGSTALKKGFLGSLHQRQADAVRLAGVFGQYGHEDGWSRPTWIRRLLRSSGDERWSCDLEPILERHPEWQTPGSTRRRLRRDLHAAFDELSSMGTAFHDGVKALAEKLQGASQYLPGRQAAHVLSALFPATKGG